MQRISSTPVYLHYVDNPEKEFILKEIGYDNFNLDYITPYKIMRIQNFYTIHIVLSGRGYLDFSDKSYELKQGDIFFVDPGESFRYYPDDNDKWEYIWFAFEGSLGDVYAKNMGISRNEPVVHCSDFRSMYLTIKSFLLKNIPSRTSGYYEALSFFYKILDMNAKGEISSDASYTEAIKSYIDAYYHKAELTVDEICEYFNISHSYICNIFKRDTGITVKGYMVSVRIAGACELLKKTRLHIQEIAFSVGFSDEIHFMKTFKKHMGVTPKEYRLAND